MRDERNTKCRKLSILWYQMTDNESRNDDLLSPLDTMVNKYHAVFYSRAVIIAD